MKKIPGRDAKLQSLPEAIPCRWKHLRGQGRKALFRATCGQVQCRGHLGDLRFEGSHEDSARDVLEEFQRDRRRAERRIARGQHPASGAGSANEELAMLARLEESARRDLEEIAADERAGRVTTNHEWRMSAMPSYGQFIYADDYARPIYSGHADTGYRVTFSRKRSRSGKQIGRRPVYPADHQPPSWMKRIYGAGRYDVLGQRVVLPALIWCPISTCGALNHLDWPEPLQDSQAR